MNRKVVFRCLGPSPRQEAGLGLGVAAGPGTARSSFLRPANLCNLKPLLRRVPDQVAGGNTQPLCLTMAWEPFLGNVTMVLS